MQQIILFSVTVSFATSLILFYFFIIKPNKNAKNAIKQKAKEDREAKRQADIILSEYPTYRRYSTDGSFQDTELGYSYQK